MNSGTLLLAQGLFRSLTLHSTALFWALLIVIILSVFIWAAFFRAPSPRRPGHHHHGKPKDRVRIREIAGPAHANGSRRRRKRRRTRAPLNPTLAQTNGLPPVRDEPSTPPPAY